MGHGGSPHPLVWVHSHKAQGAVGDKLLQVTRRHNKMSKSKAMFGMAVIVGLFAFAASPAFALFESENAKTTGTATAAGLTFTDESATQDCKAATGEWSIFSLTKQIATKTGAHEIIQISKWGTCTGLGFPETAKSCDVELKQALGSNKAVLSVLSECSFIVAGLCEIKVPASAANSNLTKVDLTNVGKNLEANLNIGHITSTATSLGIGCIGITNLTNSVGTFKGIIVGEGEKSI